MRCFFCKEDSSNSKSVEHIIPESLGNKRHVLNPGIVCDKCNQYFAIKIEKSVLDKPYFKSLRHRNLLENKKGQIPKEKGLILGINDSNIIMDMNGGNPSLIIENPNTINSILQKGKFTLISPLIPEPEKNDRDLSRLLGKIALEVLADRFYPDENLINEAIDLNQLDNLRRYVRIGDIPSFWEYHQRRLYSERAIFKDPETNESYEVLNEYDLLLTEHNLYLILVIGGIEYVIDLINPQVGSYINWLNKNNHISPLTIKKG